MPLLTANNIQINYALHLPPPHLPNPPTILLIAGLADPLTTWTPQLPALLHAGFRILTYDHRGIGHSSSPPGPYTAALLAADAHALLTALALPACHVLGVSMGGMVAQAFALAYPAAVRSLVLAATYAAPGPFCARMFARWADVARGMGVRCVMREVVLWAFTVGFFTEREEEAREVERGMEEGGEGQSVEAYLAQLAVITGFDSRAEVGRLKGVRTLVLAGEEDILIPTRLSRELAGLVEGSEWVTVRGGHACMWEFPEEFNEAVVAFLGRVEGAGGARQGEDAVEGIL